MAHNDGNAADALAALMEIVRDHVDSQDDAILADQYEEDIRRDMTASGVPYVPENIGRLPKKWRGEGKYKPTMHKEECSDELEAALASAPADGWRLVPVEPTQAMVLAYNTCGGTDRVTADGPPRNLSTEGYRAMIAAAPSDGGE